jgi:hypothetical protein
MGSFSSGLATREVPTRQAESGYQGPPRFHWFNGEKARRGVEATSGDFYVAERELKGFVPDAPWVRVEDRYQRGDVGYSCTKLNIIFLSRRSRPFANIKDAGGKNIGREFHPSYIRADTPKPWPNGVTKPSESVYTEYLCVPEGFIKGEEIHEAAFACKGMVGMRLQKILIPQYEKDVLRVAEKLISEAKGQPLGGLPAWYMFSIPVGPEQTVDKKGNVEFVFTNLAAYNIDYQLPALLKEEGEVDVAWLNEHYVGDEVIDKLQFIDQEYTEWRAEAKQVSKSAEADAEDTPAQSPFDYAAARAGVSSATRPQKGGDLETELGDGDLPF